MTATETATGSYKASEMPLGLDKELERLRWQATFFWHKEGRNLRLLGLKDGMSILEPGSGPGFITELLLTDFPNSQVTALDVDATLNQRAAEYLGSRFGERLKIVQGSISDSGLPAASFDFAYARLIFQHLPDPAAAVREIYRVLKPGGRFVIYDVDSSLKPIIEPEASKEAEAIYQKLEAQQRERGGNRAIGRRLWRLMVSAGFRNLDLEVLGASSDEVGQEMLDAIASANDPDRYKALVELGRISATEADILLANEERFENTPDKYMMVFVLMVAGAKPLT